MNATQPDPATFRALRPLALELLAARVVAQEIRAQVDAIAREVLAAGHYVVGIDDDLNGQRIMEPDRAWLMDRSRFAEYCATMRERTEAAGLHAPPDYCPALVAERRVTEIEWRFLDATAPAFGITKDHLWGKDRARWIELCVGLAMSAPVEVKL
jgi:hypothetical protein